MKQEKDLPEAVASPRLVVETVIEKLSEEKAVYGNGWELVGTPDVMHRQWNTLYFIELANGQEIRRLVVKIGHYPDQKHAEHSWQAEDLVRRGILEYNSLELISDCFSRSPNRRLKYIKPLFYIRQINAIVMEHVDGTPLHHAYYKPFHLFFASFRKRACEAMADAGEWLYTLHQMPVKLQGDIKVCGPADNYSDFSSRIDSLAQRGIEIHDLIYCYSHLANLAFENSHFDHVWRHGDYHMGNVLIVKDGGVLGFDTPLETVDCSYYDLAKFISMLKANRKRIFSLGLLPWARTVRMLSTAFLDGYFREKSCNHMQLAAYEGTFLLQRWQEELDDIERYGRGRMMVPLKAIAELMVNITFRKLLKKWVAEIMATGAVRRPSLSASSSADGGRQTD